MNRPAALRVFDFNLGRWRWILPVLSSSRRCTRPDCAKHAQERMPLA